MDPSRDEFYVGYLPTSPPALERFLRLVVLGLLLGGTALAIGLALAQRHPAPATFEYGTVRRLIGVIREHPYPLLLVERPGQGAAPVSTYLLAGYTKHGAGPLVAGLDGRQVELDGTLIFRAEGTMVEIRHPPVALGAPVTLPPELESELGPVTLTGEIVDSKCHLGAMNPGGGATHRECAIRCLRGGLPPVLATRDRSGVGIDVVLASAEGTPLGVSVLDHVAIPVQVTGRLRRIGTLYVIGVGSGAIQARQP